jgi:hypothetical protein
MPAVPSRALATALGAVAVAALVTAGPDEARASVRYFPAGVTLIASTILLAPGDAIEGEGSGQSILLAAPGFTGTLVANADLDGHNPDNRIEGVTLDCGGTAERGLHLSRNDDLLVEDVEVTRCTGPYAVQGRGESGSPLVQNQRWVDLHVHHNAGTGLFNGLRTRKAVYDRVTVSYNGGDGLFIGGSETTAASVVAHRNRGAGLVSNNIIATVMTGYRLTGNGVGLLIYDSPQSEFDGLAQNNRIDIRVANDYSGTFSYGPTRQTRVAGIAGPSPFTISDAPSPRGERAIVVETGESVNRTDLIITTK